MLAASNTTAVQHDWGFALVGGGGWAKMDQYPLDETVGSLGIEFNGSCAGQKMSAFGYPAAAPYTGSVLVYSRGTVGQDVLTGNTTWSLPSNLTGGASGGPWVQAADTTTYAGATVGSVNSFKSNFDKNHRYGPKFNSETENAFLSAETGNLRSGGDQSAVACPRRGRSSGPENVGNHQMALGFARGRFLALCREATP